MYEAAKLLYLYAEAPLHPGSGGGLGSVDLPVQRERTTQYPLVPASSLKGKLRAEARDRKGAADPDLQLVFGPDTGSASDHAGALAPGDARLLLFPVRSLSGVFAYTTSADALARLRRDLTAVGQTAPWPAIAPPAADAALVPPGCDLLVGAQKSQRLVLEEQTFQPKGEAAVQELGRWLAEHALAQGPEYEYFRAKVQRALVVLPNDAFRDFVLYATEVVTRIKINPETGTVASGALWTEEHIPSDSLFYAPLFASRPRGKRDSAAVKTAQDVLNWTEGLGLQYLQLGGNETVGQGLVRLRW